ncbi:CBS domain-containing protein [Tenacibaculum sp. 1B UA]|uniref:CBS domain-containing protein n=1 Tax=unclassified Tenacibaculum TaxID=2635139 RepID=UPI0026E21430|nr:MULTISPECIES: CBS domain-containing protein [unclassified Tenacibaculum]MDO6674356.1 CBS domain-containing protein [Tenacibaculum sp. 1_MG-2023]MDX8552107.1 CBS domain-containing protein [Tenacibaculum sp. 1B UA]
MAIKSFQGKRSSTPQEEKVPMLVSDYMSTKLITFKEEQSIEDVIDVLIKHKISGGPVVNKKNELVGIISEGDCIKQISESRYYNSPTGKNNTVGKAMVKEVETIDGNMNILDAANKFLQSRRRRFPIVENGKLAGQISQKDVLIAAMKLKGNTWK